MSQFNQALVHIDKQFNIPSLPF